MKIKVFKQNLAIQCGIAESAETLALAATPFMFCSNTVMVSELVHKRVPIRKLVYECLIALNIIIVVGPMGYLRSSEEKFHGCGRLRLRLLFIYFV